MLHIAPDFAIPDEAVTQTFAVLAKRGVGKTYATLVLVEEMLKARLQVVVADPIGVVWGLRSSADGASAGLPIAIFGGDHGDIPLKVSAGQLVAETIVDKQISAVLDLSQFRKGEQTRFMQDFCETLYHKNRAPLHLVLDEADAFAPQRPMPGQQRLLGAVEDLVRRGRARGIGVTLVTQRAAVLNKDVLTQVEVLVALRTIAPQDRDALDAWVKVHGTPEQREALMRSLPSLPIGTAWFWSPGWLDIFQRVEVRKRDTFDSSATPKIGDKRATPSVLASVDLDQLRAAMAATIERAEEEDPTRLRRRIADLQRELITLRQAAPPAPEVRVETVEIPVLPAADLDLFVRMVENLVQAARDVNQTGAHLHELGQAFLTRPKGDAPEYASTKSAVSTEAAPNGPTPPGAEWVTDESVPPPSVKSAKSVDKPSPHLRSSAPSADKVSAPQQKILDALAWWQSIGIPEPSRLQLGFIAGYSAKGGAFQNYLGALRTAGLLDYPDGGKVALTGAGRAIADPIDMPRTLESLHAAVFSRLPRPQQRIMAALCTQYPKAVSRSWLADAIEMSAAGGAFQNYLGALRSLGLLTYPGTGSVCAADILFPFS